MASTVKPDEQDEKVEQKAERGTQHPADNLESAIANLEKVREAIGFSPASRDTVIGAWGHTSMSGHASRKLGVQTHFGLLEKTGKGSLKISELGKKILVPTNSQEQRAAIVEAAGRPVLYAKLIEKYKDNALPTMLPNLLMREHGVFPGSAPNAARAFRETVEFAGLLRNGVLHRDAGTEDGTASAGADLRVSAESGSARNGQRSEADPNTGQHPTSAIKGSSTQAYTIPLDHAGRLATIHIPIPLSKRDLKKISAWVTYASDNFFDDESAETETPNVSNN
jgi:hypothetical protein